jgi:hypothetical protein
MKRAALTFIILIILNVLCTAQTLKTPFEKPADPEKIILNKTVAVIQMQANVTDSFIISKQAANDKIDRRKRKDSIEKGEIHEMRMQRINKILLDLAQILNYL